MQLPIKSAIITGLALCLQGMATAGTEPLPIEQPTPASNSGDWCEWLQNKPGTIYKDKNNPYLQEINFEGRLQYQLGHLRGRDINGTRYNEDYDQFRRFRLGVNLKFLQYFGLKYQVNLADDTTPFGGSRSWGYQDIDVAYLSFNLAKALGTTEFDKLSLVYGRQNPEFGSEGHTSSKHLLHCRALRPLQ